MTLVHKPALALPSYRVEQSTFLQSLRSHYAELPTIERGINMAEHTTVQHRYFSSPLSALFLQRSITTRVEHYIHEGILLALTAIDQALAHACLQASDIEYFIVTSCTLPAVVLPGLDAYIVNASDLSKEMRRLPIAQMGCQAGATALAQAYDHLVGHPYDHVLICNIELCSVNEQPDDTDLSMFVSRGLFGDGVSAVVVSGTSTKTGLCLLATRQHLVANTIDHMQYVNTDQGNHFRTKREVVPGLKKGFTAIHQFLKDYHYSPTDLTFLICHTGGPRVMNAVIKDLNVNEHLIAASRESLREVGNLSSATILDVLRRTFESYRPSHGSPGLLLGFGPGSTIEMQLVQWQDFSS